MNTVDEFSRFTAMTLAAGARNIDLGDRRLLIRRGLDVVTVMTVSTHCRAHVAAGNGFRVHTLAIRQEHLTADAASFHYGLISVATPAGRGDVRAINR